MAGLFRRHLEFLRGAGGWCYRLPYGMRDLCNRLGFMMETRTHGTVPQPTVLVSWYGREREKCICPRGLVFRSASSCEGQIG